MKQDGFRQGLGPAVVEPGAGVAHSPERPGQELVLGNRDPRGVCALKKAVVLPESFTHLVPAQVAEQRYFDRLAVSRQARLRLRERRRMLRVRRWIKVGRLQGREVESVPACPLILVLEKRTLGLSPRALESAARAAAAPLPWTIATGLSSRKRRTAGSWALDLT